MIQTTPSSKCNIRPQQNKDTYRGSRIGSYDVTHPWQLNAATLMPATYADKKCFTEDFQKHVLCPGHNICPPQILHVWQKYSTFGKHAHISNVVTTIIMSTHFSRA